MAEYNQSWLCLYYSLVGALLKLLLYIQITSWCELCSNGCIYILGVEDIEG